MAVTGESAGRTLFITNDDGITAPGLHALEAALRAAAPRMGFSNVVTVAPAFPRSGMSRAITIDKPVRCESLAEHRFQLDGTPADCVMWAFKHLARDRIALIVSGINHGPNLGHDIAYSGTVAAALEGARFGVPALALSLTAPETADFSHASEFAVEAVENLLEEPLPPGVAISVNIPGGKPAGVKVTRPGTRVYSDFVLERTDPFGRPYYWLAGDARLEGAPEPGTDLEAIESGFISVTPLDSDFHAPYTSMQRWARK
jgi:5'-nucleotidase